MKFTVVFGLLLPALLACHPAHIQPGPRAAQLAGDLAPSALRDQLLNCPVSRFQPSPFVIAHRGAPLGYPEHTKEGYIAAARMGAGLVECDVTFTRDEQLVCRHSQCDLHRTTNILQTPLAQHCSQPFRPAADGQPATAQCCTSDITLAQFKSLCGRADKVNDQATSVAQYLQAPLSPVTGTALQQCGDLLTHSESIALFKQLGVQFIPELKAPMVPMPFNGNFDQADYARKLVAQYQAAGIDPQQVHLQSFSLEDVLFWINNFPEYADRVVYLDGRGRNPAFVPSLADMQSLYKQGVRVVAPPMPMLLRRNAAGELEPSAYARQARQAGLQIVTWTFESGQATDPGNWLYGNLPGYIVRPGQMLEVLHALTTQVEIQGIFSDWPGTVTHYLQCTQTSR